MKQLIPTLCIVCALTVLSGCAALHESPDYVRHINSTLMDGIDGSDMLQFQAKAGSEYPENDPGAEALRIQWLEAWLSQVNKCPDGYRVMNRRAFGFAEYNPAGYDLVYELQCKITGTSSVQAPATSN
jgi:hypothetical protein